MTRKILVVDDNDDQRYFVCEVIRRYLGGWSILQAATVDQANDLIRSNNDLVAAVVDMYLSDPPKGKEGLAVLRELQSRAPGCFKILVSSKIKDRAEIGEDDPPLDEFVYLLRDRRNINPVASLQQALYRAEEHCATTCTLC